MGGSFGYHLFVPILYNRSFWFVFVFYALFRCKFGKNLSIFRK